MRASHVRRRLGSWKAARLSTLSPSVLDKGRSDIATLRAAERRGLPGAPPVAECHLSIQQSKFEVTRLQRFGAPAPDPIAKLSLLRELAGSVRDRDRGFECGLLRNEMPSGTPGASSKASLGRPRRGAGCRGEGGGRRAPTSPAIAAAGGRRAGARPRS